MSLTNVHIFLRSYLTLLVLFVISVPLSSEKIQCNSKLSEEEKIEALINRVSKIEGTFIRNGEEHNASEAADHLRLKLSNAKKSFFSSSKNWTALQFIDQLATKSSLSGIPYEIKWKDGKKILSSVWLHSELKKITESCPP